MRSLEPKDLNSYERSELVETFAEVREYSNEWIRRQVLDNDRIDILGHILGLDIRPVHLKMLKFQFEHKQTLQLAARGLGKTSVCTMLKCVHMLLKDPELKILIVSKTSTQAEAFLKEIKGNFEANEKLAEIFGTYYDPKTCKWDNREITIAKKTKITKESSITCLGAGNAIVGKHYDVIMADDLVDEENARTKGMRDKLKTWYYQTLEPTHRPPMAGSEFSGCYHRLGTRYHYDDLYGHLIANEMKDSHQIIPALNEHLQSPWPERHSAEWFLEKKAKMGSILFSAQYLCNADLMRGEIFEYDNCKQIEPVEYPEDLKCFMGIDLAISERETSDYFAIVVVGTHGPDSEYFVMDYYYGRLRFSEQTTKILEYYQRWQPIRAMIETNAYQLAKYQELKQMRPDLRLKPYKQTKDKVTRAWKLSSIFDDGRMFFKKGIQNDLIEQLVLFPNFEHDDLFDALDLAVKASKMRKTRRKSEPGLI